MTAPTPHNIEDQILDSIVADLAFIENHPRFVQLSTEAADGNLFLFSSAITHSPEVDEELQAALLSAQHDLCDYILKDGEIVKAKVDSLGQRGYTTRAYFPHNSRLDLLVSLKYGYLSMFLEVPQEEYDQISRQEQIELELIPGSLPGIDLVNFTDMCKDVSKRTDDILNQMADSGQTGAMVEVTLVVRVTSTE